MKMPNKRISTPPPSPPSSSLIRDETEKEERDILEAELERNEIMHECETKNLKQNQKILKGGD